MRQAIVLLALLALTACSTRAFEAETKAFQEGVSGTGEALIAIWDRTDALAQAERDRQRVRENWSFDLTDCRSVFLTLATALPADESARKTAVKTRKDALAACELIQTRRDGKRVSVSADPVANRKLMPAIEALNVYADGLAALTAAPDEAAFRASVSDMANALTKVGEKLKDARNSDFEVSGPVSALTSVLGEVALAGLEARKFRTMRRIVRDTDASVQNVTGKMAALEAQFRQQLLLAQNQAVQRAVDDLFTSRRSASRADRIALQQAAIDRLAEYKAFAASLTRGGVSYANVGAAHAALLDAVNNPDRVESAKLAFKRLKSLGDAAKDAKKALGF